MWRRDVRDAAAPLGFARPWWKVRLRGATGERETCWRKRGVSLVSGMICGIKPSRSPATHRVYTSVFRAAHMPMALRHHERRVATRSAHTLEAVTRAFRTRLPLKVTLRGRKTSVSYETSSESHASSLQNERFVRDFLQKSHVRSPKRAFRTRLPQKVTRQVSKTSVSYKTSSKTHMTQPCQAVSRVQPLQTTPAHTPIPM